MIISHRYRFVFIKTRKTAGTSIEAYLSSLCGPDDVVTPVHPPEPGHQPRNAEGFANHMSAARVAAKVPDLWRDYFTFCVERNPWDKTLSHFFMKQNSAAHGGDAELCLDRYLAAGDYALNLPLYASRLSGRPLVDRVLRYEHLDQELGEVFEQLGVPWCGRLPVKAKSGWRPDRRSYREVLSLRQAVRIEKIFAREIRLHGYAW
ncbi:MAG: sulfotransferase family 2 domain-containing protein [Caulobacter sp.]